MMKLNDLKYYMLLPVLFIIKYAAGDVFFKNKIMLYLSDGSKVAINLTLTSDIVMYNNFDESKGDVFINNRVRGVRRRPAYVLSHNKGCNKV